MLALASSSGCSPLSNYPKEMKSFTTISSINRLRLSYPIAKPIISGEEIKAIEEVLRSGMLAHGEVVRRFENDFSEYRGCPPNNYYHGHLKLTIRCSRKKFATLDAEMLNSC